MKNKTKYRAALYARYSSDNQRAESIDAQLRAMRKYCDENEIEVVAEYCDYAKSGKSSRRPEFMNMIADSKNGSFDVVIVHKLDRFSRDRYDSVVYMQKLKENGIDILSVCEKIEDTPESKLMLGIKQSMDQYYSDNLAREVMKGLMENAYKCLWTGGCPPLGYDLKDRKLVINEKEAKIVRMIFEMSAEGHGYNSIIRTLNALGYKTKKGRDFGKNSLYEILRNERYKGTYVFNKRDSSLDNRKRNNHSCKDDSEIIRIENGCPAIVSERLWNKVNRIRKAVNSKSNSSQKIYLLSGLIYCKCGAKYHGNTKRYKGKDKVYYSYRCSNRTGKLNCNGKEIRCEVLDSWVINEFLKYFFNEESISEITRKINKKLVEKINAEKEYNEAKENIKKMKLVREKLLQAILKIEMNDYLIEQLKDCEIRIKDAEMIIANSERRMKTDKVNEKMVKKHIDNLRDYMNNPTNLATTRYVLSEYIDKIVIDDKEITVIFKVGASLVGGTHLPDIEFVCYDEITIYYSDIFQRYEELSDDEELSRVIANLSSEDGIYDDNSHRNIEKTNYWIQAFCNSKNNDSFLDSVSNDFYILDTITHKKSHTHIYECGKNGGPEENRTPVRKQIRQSFYTLSLSFEIPSQHSDKQDC